MEQITSDELPKQKCHVCDEYFDNLEIHFLTFHNLKEEEASKDILSTSKEHLKTHVDSVDKEQKKQHKCEICEEIFCENKNLMIHIKMKHERLKNHKCDICGTTFSQLVNLKLHRTVVHKSLENSTKSPPVLRNTKFVYILHKGFKKDTPRPKR